jgi:hypothetical protein
MPQVWPLLYCLTSNVLIIYSAITQHTAWDEQFFFTKKGITNAEIFFPQSEFSFMFNISQSL